MQRRQPVREPGDRVRLARPGRVLHQVVLPGTARARVGFELEHRVPLVEAREDDRAFSRFSAFDPSVGISTWTNRASRSSQASRCHTRSHRYAVR